METLRIKRITLDATLPTRASPGSVGYDLYSIENMTINACERGIVSTGICATIPVSYTHLTLPTICSV